MHSQPDKYDYEGPYDSTPYTDEELLITYTPNIGAIAKIIIFQTTYRDEGRAPEMIDYFIY
jgi:hypothetical protein